MAIVFLESGTAATQDVSFWTVANGSPTSDTVAGSRALKLSGSTSDSVYHLNSLANGGRLSVRINLASLGISGNVFVLRARWAGSVGFEFELYLTSGGVLTLADRNEATLGTGATLSLDTDYRIGVAYNANGAAIKVYVAEGDGESSLSIDATNSPSGNPIASLVLLNSTGGAVTFYRDVYTDDDTSLADCGNIKVTGKRPAANGAANAFDTQIGTGGSGFGAGRSPQINERPLSEANGWQQAAAGQVSENYAIQAAADGDVDLSTATIVGYSGWLWAKATTGGLGTPKLTLNGNSDTAITLTPAPALYLKHVTSASYPSDSAGIGMVSTGDDDDTFLYECGVLIAYVGGSAEPIRAIVEVGNPLI